MTRSFERGREIADSGRGRPWKQESIERVEQLEREWQSSRTRHQSRAEISYTCPVTKESFFVDYPAPYNPTGLLLSIKMGDKEHRHRVWETIRLEDIE